MPETTNLAIQIKFLLHYDGIATNIGHHHRLHASHFPLSFLTLQQPSPYITKQDHPVPLNSPLSQL